MRSVLTLLSLLLVTGLACSGTSAPTATDNLAANLPSWTVTVDGNTFEAGLGDLMGDRVLSAVVPGTNMTPNQLRQYFAVNMTKATVQSWYWCPVYKQFMAKFVTLSDATILSWVVTMESNGYDVPNAPPPPPIC